MASLIERHRDQIAGVLSCYDRAVIRGTLPSVCHAKAMTMTPDARGIRLFDNAKQFAEPQREAIRGHAERAVSITLIASITGRESSTRAAIIGSTKETILIGFVNAGNNASVVRQMNIVVDGDLVRIHHLYPQKSDEGKQLLKKRESATTETNADAAANVAELKPTWRHGP